MSENFNGLTPAEEERLVLLAEECNEVALAVAKILRHGYNSYNPLIDGNSNREELEKEIGHMKNAYFMMTLAHDVNDATIEKYRKQKKATIHRWLHHQAKDPEPKVQDPEIYVMKTKLI